MDKRSRGSNNKNGNQNYRNHENRNKRNRTNQSKNTENISFDFSSSSKQKIENSNKQELIEGKQNSLNNDCQINKAKKKFNFGFKRLEELCNKSPCEIVFVMSNKTNGFMELFKQQINPDWIFLLIKISAKICSSEFNENKIALLRELACNQFFDQLKVYILNTPTDKNYDRCNKMNVFFDDCLVVFQNITMLFPKTAVERLKEIVISSNIALTGIKNYCNHIKINETIMVDMNELLQKLHEIKLTDEVKLKEKLVLENNAQFRAPPENFRELTVYPTTTDLEFGEPFLRPNISKGAYKDVEHYLDVQFRLLREDFIGPLREGIILYKEMINNNTQQNQRRKKIDNIRIYPDTVFEKKGEFIHDKNGYLINFNKANKLKINWEMTKRFMYGSLLLFTVNQCRTFILGIVLECKIELLKEGKLIVELLEEAKPLYNTTLTMVESEVFFEPYKCSMEVLKTINNNNFPMSKYIISACNEVDYPQYIETIPDLYYSVDDLDKFYLLVNDDWPTKDELGLDIMQYKAFKAALTHEFTIIQGPPGTGKTFIGLKIMKTIIHNLYSTNSSINITGPILKKPVLVVCYTNHALDQFMEGILGFTKHVVRIGGQSKSEIIEQYSLRNITRLYRKSITTNRGLRDIRSRVEDIMNKIKYFRKCSEFVSYNAGILELSLLKNGMPKKYHHIFKNTQDLLSWLFQNYNYFSVDPIMIIDAICHEIINKVFHYDKLLTIENEVEDYDDKDLYYEADDPDFKYNNKDIVIYSITLSDIENACKELLTKCFILEQQSNDNIELFNESEEAKFNFSIMEKIHDYFKDMLSLANANIQLPKSIKNLYLLDMKQRWTLYFQWVNITKEMFVPKIMQFEQTYTRIYKQYTELRQLENIEIFNNMHVIALTTTGAAKHRIMLEGLESPIVVVEEAAEVLEAHIVSSLTKYCQHLILIGDHKQLRPSNAVYKLAKDFNFDISLFERMVNNGVPCYTLGEQHRMRPEIASLVTPTIYPELQNHFSVYNRESVRGVCKNLFFLNHNVYENEVDEISSKCNEHEASFLVLFARHLLLQGYKTDQVTILTTYKGQLFKLRALSKKHEILKGIRISVVDNYQGEESDIILLSLVRSNEKGNVGFLKIENRICVALSRAKYGLYIMGNMDNLYNSGKLWKEIKNTLIDQDSYGDELSLNCAVHTDIITKVTKSEDFNMIIEGGCTMLCKSLLLCGHYCATICHSYDREHVDLKCREPCNKSCDYNHRCTKLCFMDCGKCNVSVLKELPCGHQSKLPCFVDTDTFPCEKKVEIVLEICGHKIIKRCHEKDPKCTFKCFDRLDCGHACELNCHKSNDPNHERYNCLKPCENINKSCSSNHKCEKLCHEDCSTCSVKIKKILPCGHNKNDVPCGLNINEIKCFLSCDRSLKCNHKCEAKCFQTCKPCEKKVNKVIPDCGHSITIACKSTPKRKYCTEKCERLLDCGHKCKDSCAKPCDTKSCKEIVLQKIGNLSCGHNKVRVLCCDKYKEFSMDSQYLLDNCEEPCLQKLNCDDICLGTCGKCKQGRLHIPCKHICNKINPCNHPCKSPCKERCPPCNQKCLYICKHSRCTRNCGDICHPCQEYCDWRCIHLKCTKKCFDLCNREPCNEPCKLKLQCGHECIGFCGEPCPPLCRICNHDDVTTIIFGPEDKPNARFVYLEDCGHTIVSESLEQWMNQNNEEITLKQCPLCKTPILKTQRFMNQVKLILKDITKIKMKQYGELNVLKGHAHKLVKSLEVLNKNFDLEFIGNIKQFSHIQYSWHKFCQPVLINSSNKRRKNQFLKFPPPKVIESLEYVVDLFKSISKYKERIEYIKDDQMKQTVINHFVWLLSGAFAYAQQLSEQQKSDIDTEMVRAVRILNLFEIKCTSEYKMAATVDEVKELVGKMETKLMSCQVYSRHRDEQIQHYIKLIKQKVEGISIITDNERRMIHQAMSVDFHRGSRSQGHWVKCKNGHIYCITECGGPMEKSVCPECKVEIGGMDHAYVSGVSVASEMDGARHLAWSEGNNMANYML